MHFSTVLAVAFASVAASTTVFYDPVYDAAINNRSLPTSFVMSYFDSMDIGPNRTVTADDGSIVEIFEFEEGVHDAFEKSLVQQVIALGPIHRTDIDVYNTTDVATSALASRQSGDKQSFSCLASNTYAYAYVLGGATTIVCQSIFQGSVKIGTTYARSRGVQSVSSRNAKMLLKYTWFVALFGLNNACTTLANMIVTSACATEQTGTKGKAEASAGGNVVETSTSGRTDATMHIQVDLDTSS